jgi:hypothetical protein
MDSAKIIGICHRIKLMPRGKRGPLLEELQEAIDSAPASGLIPQATNQLSHAENLRAMLGDPGIRDNGRTIAALVRAIRSLPQMQ